VQDFAKRKMGLDPATISADFPWGRLFEINAMVSPTPKYTVYLTAAEKQRRAEEAAKKVYLYACPHRQNVQNVHGIDLAKPDPKKVEDFFILGVIDFRKACI
jgi:hypothetical protein